MSERKPIGVTAPYRKNEPLNEAAWLWEPTGTVTTDPDEADGSWTKLYTSKEFNAKLEAMAVECERMPFGDTSASFAAWIRGHKL